MDLSCIQNLIIVFAPFVENMTPHTPPLFTLFYKQINSQRTNKKRQLNLREVRKFEITNPDKKGDIESNISDQVFCNGSMELLAIFSYKLQWF